MKEVNYSDFRTNLKSYMDKVYDDLETLIVKSKNNKDRDIVVMTKDEYDSIQETLYLLSSPANAERLRTAMRDFNAGENIISKEVLEVEDDC